MNWMNNGQPFRGGLALLGQFLGGQGGQPFQDWRTRMQEWRAAHPRPDFTGGVMGQALPQVRDQLRDAFSQARTAWQEARPQIQQATQGFPFPGQGGTFPGQANGGNFPAQGNGFGMVRNIAQALMPGRRTSSTTTNSSATY